MSSLTSNVSFTTVQRNAYLALVPFVGALLPIAQAHGQVIAADDAVETQIEMVDINHLDIQGGQLSEGRTNLFHSFDQFDITAGQTANFVTDSTVQNVVGRIHSAAPSTIDGTLQVSGSDANLYLMNPAGVLLGPEAQLNLSGGFTATTATGIGFEAGGRFDTTEQGPANYQTLIGEPDTFHFEASQAGAVVNLAELSVEPGEAIALIGGTVVNTGELSAPEGSITLAAVEGENLVRISQGQQLLSLEIAPTPPRQGPPSNPASIGEMLTGSGVSHATALITHPDGTVSLGINETTITESGGQTIATGNLSTQGERGGDINVLGSKVQLKNAVLNASGREGGGLIRVGGGYQEQDNIFNAEHTSVDAGSSLLANANSRGDGGTAIVRAEEQTQFSGRIVATGGQSGGNGGVSEISGNVRLDYGGSADLSAAAGELGTLRLASSNWVITDGAAPASNMATSYYASSAIDNTTGLFDLALTASDRISIEPISGDGRIKTPLGSSLTFSARTGQFLMEDTGNSLWAPGGAINISGAGIQVGHIRTDRSNGSGGNIRLTSSLGVEARAISSNNYDSGIGAGSGGDITVEANGGDLTVSGEVRSWSYTGRANGAAGNNAGAGGNISLFAKKDIVLGDRINAVSYADGDSADSGGEVSVISETGSIFAQQIRTESVAAGSDASRGGNITLSAEEGTIQTMRLQAFSRAGRDRAGNSGNVTIAGQNITVNGGISAYSRAAVREAGNGGVVNITADNAFIGPDNNGYSIKTSSIDGAGETGDAGNIFLTADTQIAVTGAIEASSAGDGDDAAISVVSDRIDLLGGTNSVQAAGISFSPATLSRPIYIGQPTPNDLDNPPGPVALNIWDSTLAAVTADSSEVAAGFMEIVIGSGAVTGDIVLRKDVSFADRVVLQSQGNIESAIVADGTPADIEAQGSLTLETASGQVQVGELRTNNGDVTINSAGSIEIELIDTRGDRETSTGATINIDTQADFVALSKTADTGASLATNSIQNNAINIRYGNSERLATAFTIGSLSNNGTAGSIGTASFDESESPLLSNQTTVGNLQLTNRGRPPVEIFETASLAESSVDLTAVNSLTATTSTSASERLSVPYRLTTVSEAAAIESVLERIEVSGSANFAGQLGLANRTEDQPPITISNMQDTLREVQKTTESQPAIVYVYFVPDAIAEASVTQDKSSVARPDDQLEMMIVTPEGEPVRRRQWGVTRSQIDGANHTLRQQVTSQFSTARQYLPPAQQLYNWIIGPIEQTLQQRGIDSIGFVMDTGLRMLPVAALHDGEQYLVENYSLGLLPTFSLTTFGSNTNENSQAEGNKPIALSAETRVLAMGASRFEHQPDLPAVSAEIDLITHDLWEGDAFLNEDFVLDNFQQQLRQKDYGIVHLATHAVFESGSLEDSYIQLWDEQLSLSQLSESLSLSQAEIDLIILSACNTALGDEAAEYGFAGFAVNAGSQSALASLWPVNDEGTLGFMSQFYQQLKTANIRSGALRQAQVSLIRGEVGIQNGTVYGPNTEVLATIPELTESGQWNFSHPSYWSAFTMIGNPW